MKYYIFESNNECFRHYIDMKKINPYGDFTSSRLEEGDIIILLGVEAEVG